MFNTHYFLTTLCYNSEKGACMTKNSLSLSILLTSNLAFGFDFTSFSDKLLKSSTTQNTQTQVAQSRTSDLSSSVVSDGLKEALRVGVDYGVKELSKEDGYLSNEKVKIPLPENLANIENAIRQAGGDEMADDLIESMNSAATQAAPKTASIFVDAVDNMSIDDAKKILAGGDEAATEYFKKHTATSLTKMIKPIVQESMKENDVAKYYDSINNFYDKNFKEALESSSYMSMVKSFGAERYLPSESDEKLDDFVTKKAIKGLFTMIADKESEIRKEPLAQTSSLLKDVFRD